jgi:hypothetical protein
VLPNPSAAASEALTPPPTRMAAEVRFLLPTGAAVASAGLLLFAAACNGDDGARSTEASKPPPVPGKLADGTTPAPMPDGVRRFRARKVIQAKVLPGQAAELLCPEAEELRERVTPVGAWISTDGLSVGYSINGEATLHSCDAEFVDGRWERCSQKTLTLDAPSAEELTKEERAAVCEDPPPSRGYVWVAVPSGTAWALVDHRSFWVAYFAVNQPAIRVSTTEGLSSGSARGILAYVDQDGRVVAEREIEDRQVVESPSG